MSIQIMQAVWANSQSTGRARLVLLAIADHQGEIGAWPSIATLAKMVNASERSVKRDIQELVELGELIVESQAAPIPSQYKTNRYWVNLPGVTNRDSGVTDLTSGVTESASGVTDWVIRGDNSWHANPIEPLLEPLLNPLPKRLPENWQPKENDWQVMVDHFPTLDLKLETHSFRDYWHSVAGAKGKKLDWDATWRNWIRNAYKRQSTKSKYALEEEKRRREIEELLKGE